MGSWLSKKPKKESRITEQDRATLQLKQQRDKIKQYCRKINVNLGKEREVARVLLKNGRKEKAILLLRKKRFQEHLLEQADGLLNNIEQMIGDIETAQLQIDVVQSLEKGNICLKQLHRLMSVEDVEKILDETKESIEYQHEIDSLISGSLTAEDEDDVLLELDDIIKESGTTQLPDLPDVPKHELPEKLPTPEKESVRPRAKEAVLA